ncbi:hypothetical protein ACFL02_03130 [Planctomycetota bacterium]
MVWFKKRKYCETVRRITCLALVVLYLLVTGTANLFHTEIYYLCDDGSHQGADLQLSGMTERGDGYNSHSAATCPVCAFLKTFHSQVFHGGMLVTAAAPPIQDFLVAEAAFAYRHPLPDLQTRAPPA